MEPKISSIKKRDIEPDLHQEQSSRVHRVRTNQQAEVQHFDHCAVFLAPSAGTTVNLPGNQNVPGTPAVEKKANKALKKKYTSTGSYVQMLPLVDDHKRHIMDIYTKLCLVEQVDTRGKIHHKKIDSYEEIFHFQTREGNPIKRIVVSGSAGIGKTTLTEKIAYDWAMGNSETLNKFKLVFALKMHSLQQSSNLEDAIFSEKLLTKDCVDQSALKEFVDKNQDEVLILLDGFDEFKFDPLDTSPFGSILNILNRKLGPECWVVITSRPPLDKLVNKSLVEKPYAHVRVEGFSDTDKEEYVNKFFPDDHVKARKLTEQIKQSDTLSDLAKSPMLLLLMCLLVGSTENILPDTMTQLYNKALSYIFQRKTRDIKDDAISKILISIGKVALGSLLSKDQSFAFRAENFEESALVAAVNAGILTSEMVIVQLKTYQRVSFMHHTFLEYCAAMYWQSLINTEEFDRILNQAAVKLTDSSRYDYLLRFCCGDNEACTNHILQKVHQGRHAKLVVICYFESQSQELPPANVISSTLTVVNSLYNWNNDSTNAFFHFLNQVAAISRGNVFFTKANSLNVSYFNFPRFGDDLAKSIKLMTNLQSLSLGTNSVTAANTNQILSSLASPSTLTELNLSWNEALGGSVSLLAPQLMKLKHLKRLSLSSCLLVAQDVPPITESMGDTLVHLSVSLNRALGGCASIWGPELGKMECLQDIYLGMCSLQGTDIEPIAVALSGVSTLVKLNLEHNPDLGGCAEMWAKHLKGMRHLKEVSLAGCELIDKDVEPIAVALSGVSTLVNLYLERNQGLGGCAEMWAKHLKGMRHLEKVKLFRCKLRDADIEPIAVALNDMPNLIHLDLGGNNALGGCASLWAQHLKRMNHLKRLTLMDCNLTRVDIEPIAESVSDMPNLISLDLLMNNQLIGCASSWAPHLKQMTKHLKIMPRIKLPFEMEQRLRLSAH